MSVIRIAQSVFGIQPRPSRIHSGRVSEKHVSPRRWAACCSPTHLPPFHAYGIEGWRMMFLQRNSCQKTILYLVTCFFAFAEMPVLLSARLQGDDQPSSNATPVQDGAVNAGLLSPSPSHREALFMKNLFDYRTLPNYIVFRE